MTIQAAPNPAGGPARPADGISVTIDGFEITVPKGTLVIRAAVVLLAGLRADHIGRVGQHLAVVVVQVKPARVRWLVVLQEDRVVTDEHVGAAALKLAGAAAVLDGVAHTMGSAVVDEHPGGPLGRFPVLAPAARRVLPAIPHT